MKDGDRYEFYWLDQVSLWQHIVLRVSLWLMNVTNMRDSEDGWPTGRRPGFLFCRPHASFTELKEPLSKFKRKQLPQRTETHLELTEDSRIKLLLWSPTYNCCYCRVFKNWHLKTFVSSVKTMRIKIITVYWGPAGYEMQASFLGSIGTHNAIVLLVIALAAKDPNEEGA